MSADNAHLSGLSAAERHLLVTVARQFYLDDTSKSDIARNLDLSRFKVARLLEAARASGLVTITLHDEGIVDEDLSARVRDHLELDEAVVVAAGGGVAEVRRQVGTAAAHLLNATLSSDDVVGVGWGRTLTAMTEALTSLPPISVVQLTGAVGSDLRDSPVEILRKVSLTAGGSAHPIFAPLIVDDAVTAAAFRRQPDVAAALRLFGRLTVAVVAVGSWNPPSSQLRDFMSQQERTKLENRGVRAEVTAILIDDDGSLVDEDFADRCLSISARELGRVPRVIAVAGGTDKANAVAAVTRSGLITTLVTDRALAEQVLTLPATQVSAAIRRSRGRRRPSVPERPHPRT